MWTMSPLGGGIMGDYLCFPFSQIYNILFCEHLWHIQSENNSSSPPKIKASFQAFWPSFLVQPFSAIGVKFMFEIDGHGAWVKLNL